MDTALYKYDYIVNINSSFNIDVLFMYLVKQRPNKDDNH